MKTDEMQSKLVDLILRSDPSKWEIDDLRPVVRRFDTTIDHEGTIRVKGIEITSHVARSVAKYKEIVQLATDTAVEAEIFRWKEVVK